MRRAKEQLGVTSVRDEAEARWLWTLPETAWKAAKASSPAKEGGRLSIREQAATASGMPRKAAKVAHGGKRLSEVDVERRTARVAELLKAQASRADILAVMSAEFGAAPRTVDDYIARARDRFAVETAATSQEERAATLARLDKLARKLEAQGAWSALVNVERLLADVRGLRRGTVAVETPPPAPAQPFPEVSVEEAIEECFLAVEAVASSWASGSFPTPSPERIEGLREAVRKAAEALGVFPTTPLPRLLGAHYDAE